MTMKTVCLLAMGLLGVEALGGCCNVCPRACAPVCPRVSSCAPAVGERWFCRPVRRHFVSVRPQRVYDPQSGNFDRPWPWGPYWTGL